MIQLNKNAAGRRANIVFGLVTLIDGLVRVFSLGFLHTTLPLNTSRKQTKAYLEKLKSIKGYK